VPLFGRKEPIRRLVLKLQGEPHPAPPQMEVYAVAARATGSLALRPHRVLMAGDKKTAGSPVHGIYYSVGDGFIALLAGVRPSVAELVPRSVRVEPVARKSYVEALYEEIEGWREWLNERSDVVVLVANVRRGYSLQLAAGPMKAWRKQARMMLQRPELYPKLPGLWDAVDAARLYRVESGGDEVHSWLVAIDRLYTVVFYAANLDYVLATPEPRVVAVEESREAEGGSEPEAEEGR